MCGGFRNRSFPPENVRALALLRDNGIRISTGENACTAFAFKKICLAGTSDFLQPSVTKVGGLTEVLKILKTNGGPRGLPLLHILYTSGRDF